VIKSKLKEAIICLKAGRVTLPYPFAPAPPAEGFRGRPELDIELCIGCAGCANVCPPRCILVFDSGERRRMEWHLDRCTYCGRCADVCPEKAITLSQDFETACQSREEMLVVAELEMGNCGRCGRCFPPQTALDEMMITGFREPPPGG
jgi:hydrogenase-4 component H